MCISCEEANGGVALLLPSARGMSTLPNMYTKSITKGTVFKLMIMRKRQSLFLIRPANNRIVANRCKTKRMRFMVIKVREMCIWVTPEHQRRVNKG